MDSGRPLGDSPLFGLLPPRLQDELVAAGVPVQVPAQEWLFREGDPGDRLYAIVSGRVRVVADREGDARILTTLGPGAVIGELAVLTGASRSASVQAVRDTALLEIDGQAFADLLQRDPQLGAGLARALAERLQSGGSTEPSQAPVSVVTVVCATRGREEHLWSALCAAFDEMGRAAVVSGQPSEWTNLESWGARLGDLEHDHEHVVLRADLESSEWTGFCLRQADRVVVVASGDARPALALPSGVDVVFLGVPSPDDVAAWTVPTSARAHHVVPPDARLDAAAGRIARRVTGRSLGLVLSGGGARAFAHMGVLEVFAGEGIVPDRIGGTSMGAFVGALTALGWDPATMVQVCDTELARRAPFSDYTFPRYALIRARRAASLLRRLFGDTAVEQLEVPLFTVSADLVSSQMVVHRTGPLFEAVGASMAIPGLAPPLARHRSLLVDGGVLNNLPIDVMVESERGPVVAVDVMRRLDVTDETDLAEVLPTILETLSRATVLGSVSRAESNRPLCDVLIAPDVQSVPLRGFRRLHEAVDAGRRAAEDALAAGAKETIERGLRGEVGPRTASRSADGSRVDERVSSPAAMR
ncbi:MAG: patatin-like phospholipase family protein [Gaiellaceae bacterium]